MAGDYQLDVVIGIGAVGEVYRGEHQHGGEHAAVKLLQAGALGREDLVERIVREGSIASGLDNPHLVKVLGAGRLRDGAPWLAMELLRGRDLAARLRQDGQLRLDDTLGLARQVADGLHHAHAAGIVHRDLKPRNIFAHRASGSRVVWKLLDFGVCKLESNETLSSGDVIGTPTDMAPEQARAGAVDRRADIHALGAIAYRALAGRPAFSGADIPAVLYAVVHTMPPAPSQVAGVPPAFDPVIAVALAKDPAHRFATATELLSALRDAAAGRVSAAVEARVAAAAAVAPEAVRAISALP
jgi:serine/threonine-protein kinase